jgi:hypothetical protein
MMSGANGGGGNSCPAVSAPAGANVPASNASATVIHRDI